LGPNAINELLDLTPKQQSPKVKIDFTIIENIFSAEHFLENIFLQKSM
jgi:hypothetical protein